MSMSRRKFTRAGIIGGVSLAATSGIFFPKPSEAFILGFLLRALTSRNIFGGLMRYAAGRLSRGAIGPTQDELLAIQIAERDFIERKFTRDKTEIARVSTSVFWGQQRQDAWGPNAGFAFVQKYQDTIYIAKFTGPTMAGIYAASQILSNHKLSPSEVQQALFPVRTQVDSWCNWEGDSFPGAMRSRNVCYASYRTILGEVTVRYDLLKPGIGGRGNVQVTVEAAGQPRRDIIVEVTFS
jgi:hypothetical protein